MDSRFPDGFLWGAASAAHQVEGNNVTSDAWVLEHMSGSMYAEPSRDAVDFYHRYREDVAMVAGLGLNSLRLGVEWAASSRSRGWSLVPSSTTTAASSTPVSNTG